VRGASPLWRITGSSCQAPFCDEAEWGQFALDENLLWSAEASGGMKKALNI